MNQEEIRKLKAAFIKRMDSVFDEIIAEAGLAENNSDKAVISRFLSERYELNRNQMVKSSEVFQDFCTWQNANNLNSVTHQKFSRILNKEFIAEGICYTRKADGGYFKGIAMKEEFQND